jgi:hypothetical protein
MDTWTAASWSIVSVSKLYKTALLTMDSSLMNTKSSWYFLLGCTLEKHSDSTVALIIA